MTRAALILAALLSLAACGGKSRDEAIVAHILADLEERY
jgi:hypothetical protein